MEFLDNFTIKTKYGALAVTATPIIIIGGIYMALAYTRKAWTRKPVHTRSMSIGVLHGGKLALERLVHYHQALVDKESLNDAEATLKTQLEEGKPNFKELQVIIGKLEMSGKETEAVKILKEKWNQAESVNKSHEAYEIEMLLVEMLIYKGNFHEAGEHQCLKDEQITDARRPLFLAIIHIMSEDSKLVQKQEKDSNQAREYWENFNVIRTHFHWPPGLQDIDIQEIVDNFDKFKKVIVKVFKKDNKKQ